MQTLHMLKPRSIYPRFTFSKPWSGIYICSPFYYHGLTLIPACISNYMPSKVWDEITNPFLNFNGATVDV